VPLRVFTADNRLIGVFGEKRRIPVTLENTPECLRSAFVAGEDARFYEHPGVDYQGITRAAWSLLTTGEKSIGGSTITQQLARNFFLSSEKTFTRKIKEIFLALRIERELDKDHILELYMNKIFLGYRAYGVGAAAEVYYGKAPRQLSLAQCAILAALPKAPSRINPITSPERATERRDYVRSRMLELGYIDGEQHARAIREEDRAYYHGAIAEISAPYVAEMARAQALQLLGPAAYEGGYTVITTIDSRLQLAANAAVTSGLDEYDQRHGFRGPEAHVDLAGKLSTEDWASEIVALDDLSTGFADNLDGVDCELVVGSFLDDDVLEAATAGAAAVVHLGARPSVPARSPTPRQPRGERDGHPQGPRPGTGPRRPAGRRRLVVVGVRRQPDAAQARVDGAHADEPLRR